MLRPLKHPRLRLAVVSLNVGVLLLVLATWCFSYPAIAYLLPQTFYSRLWGMAYYRHASFLFNTHPSPRCPPFGLTYPASGYRESYHCWGVTLYRGQLAIHTARAEPPHYLATSAFQVGDGWMASLSPTTQFVLGPYYHPPTFSNAYGFHFSLRSTPDSVVHLRSIIIPFWMPTLLLAGIMYVLVRPHMGHYQYRRRQMKGLCPSCLYDLREHQSGQKCPECGTVIEKERGAGGKAGKLMTSPK